jgi:hypothetical protein
VLGADVFKADWQRSCATCGKREATLRAASCDVAAEEALSVLQIFEAVPTDQMHDAMAGSAQVHDVARRVVVVVPVDVMSVHLGKHPAADEAGSAHLRGATGAPTLRSLVWSDYGLGFCAVAGLRCV